jgi:hypothetical protein
MKTWFTSLNGAVTLAALALLSFIGYVLMEFRYFLERWIPGNGAAALETIVVLLIVGGWLWALFAAQDGKRGGLAALSAFCVLAIVIAVYDLVLWFSSIAYPLEKIMILAMFVFSLIALVALAGQFRQKRK